MILPLDGVRVVDLSTGAMGPYGTRMLADYGADVLKIEEPVTGDSTRRMGPFYHDEPDLEKSGLYLLLNTSKRGMTLNIRMQRGKEILKEMVRKADILFESYKPGTMRSLGLSYDELSTINPKLVMVSITNFGQSGPYKDWEAEDLTLYAMGGNMFGSGDPELEPLKTSGRMTTFHVGYCAALAASIALWGVDQRGRGDYIDLSAFDAMMQSTDSRMLKILGYQYSNEISHRVSPASQLGLGSGTYMCTDGYFMLTAGPAMFPATARMIGADYLLEQPEWKTVAARSRPEAAEEFDALLVPWCLERSKAQIRDACIKFGVLGGALNTIEDLLNDEGFKERNFFQQIDHPATGPLTYPGFQFRLHTGTGEKMPARRPAPLLGQHTKEVLTELGYSSEDIGRLREQGVI